MLSAELSPAAFHLNLAANGNGESKTNFALPQEFMRDIQRRVLEPGDRVIQQNCRPISRLGVPDIRMHLRINGRTEMVRFLVMMIGLLLSSACMAQTAWNTMGFDDSTAISGYDVVAFHTVKKTVRGDPKISHMYADTKWVFATEENKKLFEANPESYLPAWGGHCAWAVSENLLSRKLLSGDFEFIDGKLYLFSFGNSRKSSARDDFLYGRPGRDQRIRYGNGYWPDLKRKLEDGSIVQATSKNYTKSRFEDAR
jgi:hypothetical protein